MNELTDLSPMPFGVHRGKPLQDVPASYFHHLHITGIHDGTRPDQKAVSAYIKANLSALKMDYKDGIW